MDPTPLVPTLANVLTAAARPFVRRAWSALVRKGHARGPDAAERFRRAGEPRAGDFAALSAGLGLPPEVAPARLLEIVALPRFRFLATRLIALRITGPAGADAEQSREALFGLFAGRLFADAKGGRRKALAASFRPAFDALWQALDTACGRIARRLAETAGESCDLAQVTSAAAIVEAIEHRLAAGPLDEPGDDVWLAKYRAAFDRAYGTIPLPGLGARREVPFADLYVEPAVSPTGPGPWAERPGLARIVDELDRTVVTGGPGAGKSTLSRGAGIHWTRTRGPVFLLPVRELDLDPAGFDVVREIERWVAGRFRARPPRGLVERALLEGDVLVVFDGLDEVPSPARRKSVSRTIEAVGQAFPLSAILVTARGIGYPAIRLDAEQFAELEIRPFDDGRVEEYARRWFRLAAGLDGPDLEDAVARFTDAGRPIGDLRGDPLTLSFLCVLHRAEADIPRRRTRIYRTYVELLLRGTGEGATKADGYEAALTTIAALMLHTPGIRDGITERQLRAVASRTLLSDVVADRRAAERLVREVVALSRGRGHLFTDIGRNGDGEEVFAFTHRSLMELFAARHHVRHASSLDRLARELVPHIVSQKDPVLAQMCVAIVGEESAAGSSRMILELLAEAERAEQPHAGVLREFCLVTADTVPLDADALRGVLSGFLERMPTSSAHGGPRLLLGPSFRHADAVPDVLAPIAAERLARDPVQFRQLCQAHPWLWEFCLERRLLALFELPVDYLETLFDRLLGGELHGCTRRPPFTSAMALLSSAFDRDSGLPRTAPLRDLLYVHRSVRDPFRLHQLTALPRLVDDPGFVPAVLALGDRVLARAAGHRKEVLGAALYLVLALGELVAASGRDLGEQTGGLALRLFRARGEAGPPEWEPPGMNLLSDVDARFLRAWIRRDVTIFAPDADYAVA